MKNKKDCESQIINELENENQDHSQTKVELTLEEQLLELQKENQKLNEQRLLALANLDNTRKMFERDLKESRQYFFQNLAKELIQILDNFSMAFNVKNVSEDVKQFLKGFSMTYKMLQDILSNYGVNEISVKIGDQFDSHYHQVTTQMETDDFVPDTIVKVLRQGYKIYDRVLRPVEVIIAKKPQKDHKKEENIIKEEGDK